MTKSALNWTFYLTGMVLVFLLILTPLSHPGFWIAAAAMLLTSFAMDMTRQIRRLKNKKTARK